ncbi:unnamed protein product [Phytomonas sp. Hart1]|nr:unnamed protein product [Phytomonas sp. Hart1]|eukprot:CCW66481.1 unnamed protein product [Phytomonas sp. isolate Hart1]
MWCGVDTIGSLVIDTTYAVHSNALIRKKGTTNVVLDFLVMLQGHMFINSDSLSTAKPNKTPKG